MQCTCISLFHFNVYVNNSNIDYFLSKELFSLLVGVLFYIMKLLIFLFVFLVVFAYQNLYCEKFFAHVKEDCLIPNSIHVASHPCDHQSRLLVCSYELRWGCNNKGACPKFLFNGQPINAYTLSGMAVLVLASLLNHVLAM